MNERLGNVCFVDVVKGQVAVLLDFKPLSIAATSDLAGLYTPGILSVEADSKNKKRLGVYNTK